VLVEEHDTGGDRERIRQERRGAGRCERRPPLETELERCERRAVRHEDDRHDQ